jgi:hypothetical protein
MGIGIFSSHAACRSQKVPLDLADRHASLYFSAPVNSLRVFFYHGADWPSLMNAVSKVV